MNFDGIAFQPISSLPSAAGVIANESVFLTTVGTVSGSAIIDYGLSFALNGISTFTTQGGFDQSSTLSIAAIASCSLLVGSGYVQSVTLAANARIDLNFIGGISKSLSIAGIAAVTASQSLRANIVITIHGIAAISQTYIFQMNNSLTISAIASIVSPGGVVYQNNAAIESISSLTVLAGTGIFDTVSIDAIAAMDAQGDYAKNAGVVIAGTSTLSSFYTYFANPTLAIQGIATLAIVPTLSYLLATSIDGRAHIDIEGLYNNLILSAFAVTAEGFALESNGTQPVGAVGSFSATCTGVFNRTITQTLNITQNLGRKKPTEIFQTLITLEQIVEVRRIRFGAITETLTLTQDAEAKRPVAQHLVFSQSATVTKVKSLTVSQTLSLTQTAGRQATIYRTVTDTLVLNPPLIRRTGLVGSQGQSGLTAFQYTVNPASFILVPNKCLVILSVPGRSIILPCPQFGDSNAYQGTVNLKRTMTGDTFTYIRKVDLEKVSYTFHIGTYKAIELKDFLLNFSDKQMTLINWLGETWFVNLANNPYEFNAAGRWQNKGERYEITLEFEGVKVTL